MRVLTTSVVSTIVAIVSAFKNSSPFILFSTAKLPSTIDIPSTSEQVKSNISVLQTAKKFLSSCPSDVYILIAQPNVEASDFAGSRPVPNLRRAMGKGNIETSISISEVAGLLKMKDVEDYIIAECNPESKEGPAIVKIDLEPLPASKPGRAAVLSDNDAQLRYTLDGLQSSYTVIYLTTPRSDKDVSVPSYEAGFMEPLHTEMKRQSNDIRSQNNSTMRAHAPLFETYQFFTPGIFMGLLVTFILFAILSVAISALSSLEVSYGAFDKENGPAAQRKQQ